MIARSLLALLLLLSFQPVNSEPLELLVRSYPPGALMRDQFGNSLGRSGEKVTLDWDRAKGTLQLQLVLPGHKSVTRSLTYREIAAGTYPSDGQVTLPAESFQVTLLDLLKYRPGSVLGGLAVVLGLAGAIVVKLRSARSSLRERPKTVGRYELRDKVGQGATAEVFQAVSQEDSGGLPVALKLMKDTDQLDGQTRDRFRREIKLSLSLSHPNLLEVHDWGETEDGRLYLVTELLEGGTLREELRRKQRPELPLVEEVIEAVGQALQYLHQRGFVHRDVKPDNIFLTSTGVKLMDLGISKGDDVAPLTQVGTAMGTPHYMAPEQINGEAVPASDQYALGVMCFELLTGHRPYRASEGVEILRKHLSEPIPRVRLHRDLGPLVDDVVAKAMAKNAESRFPDVRSFADSLCRALQGGDAEPDTAAF